MNNLIVEHIKGVTVKFKTKPGIFSRKGFDRGSKLLLESINIVNGSTIADLGCGTGIIGLAAAKLNPGCRVFLFDVNIRAVELAKENAELNELRNIEVYVSDIFSALPDRLYNQILSNPPQHLGNKLLEEIVEQSFIHLKPNGEMVWVMQEHILPYVKRIFEKHFGNHKVLIHNREYIVIRARKTIT